MFHALGAECSCCGMSTCAGTCMFSRSWAGIGTRINESAFLRWQPFALLESCDCSSLKSMFLVWNVPDVTCSCCGIRRYCCGMLLLCSSCCGMLPDVQCSSCCGMLPPWSDIPPWSGMFLVWSVPDVTCSCCGMLPLWNAPAFECS